MYQFGICNNFIDFENFVILNHRLDNNALGNLKTNPIPSTTIPKEESIDEKEGEDTHGQHCLG